MQFLPMDFISSIQSGVSFVSLSRATANAEIFRWPTYPPSLTFPSMIIFGAFHMFARRRQRLISRDDRTIIEHAYPAATSRSAALRIHSVSPILWPISRNTTEPSLADLSPFPCLVVLLLSPWRFRCLGVDAENPFFPTRHSSSGYLIKTLPLDATRQ